MPKELERKALPLVIKAIDAQAGIVEAIVSTLGIVDLGGDMIVSGAYTKTITERGRKVRVLDHHNAWSVHDVIGKVLEMREIGRDEMPAEILAQHPECTGGLWTRTQYALDTAKGRDAFALIAGGYVDEYSIGFECMQYEYIKMGEEPVRVIREVRLWEYSPVVWGMNPATATVGVKTDASVHTFMQRVLGEAKAGRVLSSGNAARIRSAFDALYQVLESAGLLDDDEDDEKGLNRGNPETPAAGTGQAAEPSAPDMSAKSLTAKRDKLLAQIRDEMRG